jgi:hypothetical protein
MTNHILIAFLLALPLLEQSAPPAVETPYTPDIAYHIDAAPMALVAPLSPTEALADKIITCESHWRNVSIIDSNGLPSRGIAQFQDRTWKWMSEAAGVEGSPLEPAKAKEVLMWALANGHGKHWSCWRKIVGMI